MKPFLMKLQVISTLALPALLAGLAPAQTCPIAVDLNAVPTPFSSEVTGARSQAPAFGTDQILNIGNDWYFVAETIVGGTELYRSNLTTTTKVAEINPFGHANPDQLIQIGGQIYFSATDGVLGRELWTSDGTAAGTQMVKDIWPGIGSSNPTRLIELNGRVLFTANDGPTGRELWISDGSSAGTQRVFDINPGVGSSSIGDLCLAASGTEVLFRAKGSNGSELWSTDGTSAGTHMVADINPGAANSTPTDLITWNGRTFFSAEGATSGIELYSTDGTGAGTIRMSGGGASILSSQPDLSDAVAYQGALYYSATSVADGRELWSTDGTVAGTGLAFDVRPINNLSSVPADMTVVGGSLFFSANPDLVVGRELMMITGLALTMVKDIAPGNNNSLSFDSNHFVASGGDLYFVASHPAYGRELWRSNGTAAGTRAVKDLKSGKMGSLPEWLTPHLNGGLVFSATTNGIGRELYTTNGSGSGTAMVTNIEPDFTTPSSSIGRIVSLSNNSLLFTADNGVSGSQLWSWSPSAGPALVKDISPNSVQLERVFIEGQERVFFQSSTPVGGSNLWVTDGTAAGTQSVSPANPSSGLLIPLYQFVTFGDKVFFQAVDLSTAGYILEIWTTKGTTPTTVPFTAISSGLKASSPGKWVQFEGRMYFTAETAANGRELWVTDGTAPGTHIFADLVAGAGSSDPTGLILFQGTLLFNALSSTGQRALWTSDGTPGGTSVLMDDLELAGDSRMRTELGGKLVFHATRPSFGAEPWITDLTPGGTSLLLDINPGSGWSSPENFVEHDGQVFFTAQNGSVGRELWATDGTPGGTYLFADIDPGFGSAFTADRAMVSTGAGLYMAANDGVHGEELFLATSTGVSMVCEAFPGSASGNPHQLTLIDGELAFVARSIVKGYELHHIVSPGSSTKDLGLATGALALRATAPTLGLPMDVTASGNPAGSLAALVMSGPVFTASNFLTLPTSPSWIDPATASLVQLFLTPGFTMTTNLPASPSLAGAQVNLQVYSMAGGLFPAATSNGLALTLQN